MKIKRIFFSKTLYENEFNYSKPRYLLAFSSGTYRIKDIRKSDRHAVSLRQLFIIAVYVSSIRPYHEGENHSKRQNSLIGCKEFLF